MWKVAMPLVLAGCGSRPQFVGTEELGASELRVVVARTSETSEVVALPIDRPYRFEKEPLDDVLARGDALSIAIFGFTRAQLIAGAPGLGERSLDGVIAALSPELGDPAPGRYAPPAPEAILTAAIGEGSSETVAYTAIALEQVTTELRFGFALAGEIACPPLGSMRAFNRSDPGVACVVERNSACEWNAGCLAAISAPTSIRESSDRRLLLPDGECAPIDPELGETRAWQCGSEVIAIQETVGSSSGGPWIPTEVPPFTSGDFSKPHVVAPSVGGLLVAVDDAGTIGLRRLVIGDAGPTYQDLQTPLLDGVGRTSNVTASSNDGITVAFDAELDARIGVGREQCFQTLAGRRQDRAARIERKVAADTIELAPPGIGVVGTSAWQIVGDPGPDFIMTPDVVELRAPDLGSLLRLSKSPRGGSTIAVHGGTGTVRAVRLDDRFPNDLNYFACALAIARPAELVGELVAGTDRFYGIGANGLLTFDAEGIAAGTLGGPRAFTAEHRLTVVEGEDGTDRAIVWRGDRATILGPAIDRDVALDGELLAVLDGPRFVVRLGERILGIADPIRGSLARIPVPPFGDGGRIELAPEAAIEVRGRTVLGFSDGTCAGMIDVASGLSSALPIAGARITALFEGPSRSEIWAAVETGGSELRLLRFPLVP